MEQNPLQESAAALAKEMDAFLKEREAGTPVLEDPYICSDIDGRPLEDDGEIWNYEFETLRQFRLRFEARIDAVWDELRVGAVHNLYLEDAVRTLKSRLPIKTNDLYVFPAQLRIIAGE